MFDEFISKANELRSREEPFAMAFVVRIEKPISGKPGNKAIITKDGNITGWIGGGCTKDIIVQEALAALKDGQARLIRVSPDSTHDVKVGIMTYNMTCHSGGTVDVYIDPVLAKPHLVVLGNSPVGISLVRIAKAMDYKVTLMTPAEIDNDLNPDFHFNEFNEDQLQSLPNAYVVVCTQGEGDENALSAALRSEHKYVAFVASRKKANGIFMYLKDTGIGFDQLGKVKVPAGLDIGARKPEEIALSILAEIVSIRKKETETLDSENASDKRAKAIDPICGMTVEIETAKHISEFNGENYYFCCGGCKTRFEKEPEKYVSASG